jgi:predicted SPOUT superfamily RNA methylase MTH1
MERRSLEEIADRKRFDLIIATSKNGALINDVADKLTEKWKVAKTILLAFGAPTRGLYEIAESDGFSLDDVADFVVNTVPRQGTVTVRTEEALIASLSVLNCHMFKA